MRLMHAECRQVNICFATLLRQNCTLHCTPVATLDVKNMHDIQADLCDPPLLYEAIRIINGKPMFGPTHLRRLATSFALSAPPGTPEERVPMTILDEFLQEVIRRNPIVHQNVRIYMWRNSAKPCKSDNDATASVAQLMGYYVASCYPPESAYEEGCYLTFVNGSRPVPQAKVWHDDLRARVAEKLHSTEAFEALIVTPEGVVPEGSRSNYLVVDGEKIVTSPTETVLPGVTREVVLRLCDELGIQVEERPITYAELVGGFGDAVAMLSTSVGVFPVSRLGERQLASVSNPVLLRLRAAYCREAGL